jgi:hypothetical protein
VAATSDGGPEIDVVGGSVIVVVLGMADVVADFVCVAEGLNVVEHRVCGGGEV